MKTVLKIIFTPLVFLFGLLCGIARLILAPFDITIDFWNDTL